MRIGQCASYAMATAAILTLAAGAERACADLRESQVLVVYDSRIADSLAIADYYAGSEKVPAGSGTSFGLHPGVHAVDLATLPGAGVVPPAPDITQTTFVSNIRDPLRAYLTQRGLTRTIRCIVLTKGIPHRVQDSDNPGVGDQPGQVGPEASAGDANYASVDSELTLLWQNLTAGEAGGMADSKSDGMIPNPYSRQTAPINAYTNQWIASNKVFFFAGGYTGFIWRYQTAGGAGLTPGDIYLVCRLDGATRADVFAALDRAQNLEIDLDSAALVLDEQASNGVQNLSDTDGEFDNDGPAAYTNAGDDYEQTRDFVLADGRFAAANVNYNQWNGAANFIVGPRVDFGGGLVVSQPVLLLATLGNNHNSGMPTGAGIGYADSFNYPPGAIFNTIESFNGRALGGLGMGPTPQEQLADFIAAGGTFAIGNVWEPLSWTIGDNSAIVRNFLLGDLTWAEAAYTAIPALSWQQIVVGDPLAKVRRVKEDLNRDGVNNVDDLYAWQATASRIDLNRSGAIDDADWRLLMQSIRGSESGMMRPVGR